MADRRDLALSYYRTLDDGDYEALTDLLASGFVHDRPDTTLEGRERFVRFMREERPRTDTTHDVDAVYGPTADDAGVAVRGRLLADGALLVEFVDAFSYDGGAITRINTYTR
jgi:ketosteroid isomerase-like protein